MCGVRRTCVERVACMRCHASAGTTRLRRHKPHQTRTCRRGQSLVASSAFLCPHLFQTDDLACMSSPRWAFLWFCSWRTSSWKRGADDTALGHSPGDLEASSGPNALLFLACGAEASRPALGSERSGRPCECKPGPNPRRCVFRCVPDSLGGQH